MMTTIIVGINVNSLNNDSYNNNKEKIERTVMMMMFRTLLTKMRK